MMSPGPLHSMYRKRGDCCPACGGGAAREENAGRDGAEPALEHRGLFLGRRAGLAEIDRRRLRDGLLVFDAEARLHLVTEHHRREVDRELADEHVVFLYGFYIAVA